jgi:5-methylcytosine-specific restriction enzyme A
MFKNPFAPKKIRRILTAADKKRIAAKQDWKCRGCKRTLSARYHIDHIKEYSSGESNKPSNLQALCPNCHAEKSEHD